MNISCNIVPYTMVECLCAGKPQHDPGQCCPAGQSGQGSGPPPQHCLFISHGCQLSSGVYWEVLWDAVLTCLKLSPGTPESTLVSGQCTLVCCCSSVLHCQNRRGDTVQPSGREALRGLTQHTSLKGPAAAPGSHRFESCPKIMGTTEHLKCVGSTIPELGMC